MPKEWHKPKNPSPKLKSSGEPAPVNTDTGWTASASPSKKRGPIVQPLTAKQEQQKDEAAKAAAIARKEEEENWQRDVSKHHKPWLKGAMIAGTVLIMGCSYFLPERHSWEEHRMAGGLWYDYPDAERCIKAFDQAVKDARFKYTEDSAQFIAYEEALGKCYEKHGRYLSAADCYMNAVKIIDRQVPPDKSELRYALEEAAKAYRKNANLTEAKQAEDRLNAVIRGDMSIPIAFGAMLLIFLLQAMVMAFKLASDGPDDKEVVKNTFWIYLAAIIPIATFFMGYGFYLMGAPPLGSMFGACFISFGIFPLFFLGIVAATQNIRDNHYLIGRGKEKKTE